MPSLPPAPPASALRVTGMASLGRGGSVRDSGAGACAGPGAGTGGGGHGHGPGVALSYRISHPRCSPVRRNSLPARPIVGASLGVGAGVVRLGRGLAVTSSRYTPRPPCSPVRRFTMPVHASDRAAPRGRGRGGGACIRPGHSRCEGQPQCRSGCAPCQIATSPLRCGALCHRPG